jgi:hypothetical protein
VRKSRARAVTAIASPSIGVLPSVRTSRAPSRDDASREPGDSGADRGRDSDPFESSAGAFPFPGMSRVRPDRHRSRDHGRGAPLTGTARAGTRRTAPAGPSPPARWSSRRPR